MNRLLSGPLTVDSLTIEIAGLPSHLYGTKIAQLSDLHYDGLRLSDMMLVEAIAKSNALQPDIVVLTGDHVTDDPTPIHDLVQRLCALQSRAGVYAILGNHDIVPAGAQSIITDAFTQAGIHVLWNDIAYPFGAGLPLVGLADLWSKDFKPAPILNQLDDAIPRIVLAHNPDCAVRLKSWRVDLQLSGHTHGGQIVIPGLGPFPTWYQKVRRYVPKRLRRWLPYMSEDCHKVVKHWEWAQGLHQVGSNCLYVNRGLGTYLPGRLFCPPELTVITLMGKPSTLPVDYAPSCADLQTRNSEEHLTPLS
ncbi:MAG: metallophosphoesterase [Elainellaceae cyanobacterium]